mmetsp:Transcript_10035/g.9719  ORF Transcript_10035/g.9719 Transcript_10035/m.9719 type:complete len:90 (+) Transcript_10035:477-746(+)
MLRSSLRLTLSPSSSETEMGRSSISSSFGVWESTDNASRLRLPLFLLRERLTDALEATMRGAAVEDARIDAGGGIAGAENEVRGCCSTA